MVTALSSAQQAGLHDLLASILSRFGGAIEFWTIACISRAELGDPEIFVNEQWTTLRDEIQEFRSLLSDLGPQQTVSPAIQEQIFKLTKDCSDLREVFETFTHFDEVPLDNLERAVLRLATIWNDLKLRVVLLGAILPLPEPLPSLTSDREAYYQAILDDLFDRFESSRSSGSPAMTGSIRS